jgi:hypothetical protein
MAGHERAPLTVNGVEVATEPVNDFLADAGRAASFITNFGNWQLPPPIADAMGTSVGHLEWFHDTGELVLVGAVPRVGEGSIEITNGDTATVAEGLLAPGNAPGHVERRADGATREVFPQQTVPADTVMAVLAHITSGPKVHEVLWGWHRAHRKPDGWTWLEGRLAGLA